MERLLAQEELDLRVSIPRFYMPVVEKQAPDPIPAATLAEVKIYPVTIIKNATVKEEHKPIPVKEEPAYNMASLANFEYIDPFEAVWARLNKENVGD